MKSSKANKAVVSHAELQRAGDLHDILRNGSSISNETMKVSGWGLDTTMFAGGGVTRGAQAHATPLLQQKCGKVNARNFSSFMIYARELNITWGNDSRYWRWPWLEEDLKVEVAELLQVCWLEVHGSFEMSNLDRGHKYDVMFVIMMKDPAGFEADATLKLELPDGEVQQRKLKYNKVPRKEWVMAKIGDFVAKGQGEIKYSLLGYDDPNWKSGLIIAGVLIKHSTLCGLYYVPIS